MPSEQQVTSFLQQAGKKKKAPRTAAAGKTRCSHCKGTGHNKKRCTKLHLAAEVARQQQAAEEAAAAGGGGGQAVAALIPAPPAAARVRKVVECQHCGGSGHNARGCQHKKAGLSEQEAHAAEHMRASQPPPSPSLV